VSPDRCHLCVWSPEQFHAFLDGDLDPSRESALRLHLERCADCRERADEAAGVLAALRRLPSLPCPDHVLASLEERARTSGLDPLPGARPVADGGSSAPVGWGLLAVAAAVLLLFVRRPDPAPTPAGRRPSADPPVASTREIERAERQVMVAFRLFHALGQRGVSLASEQALEHAVLAPASKFGLALRESSASGDPGARPSP
jgi:anti-sigma factor RsiW